MVIDFEKIAEAHLEGFKGGKGKSVDLGGRRIIKKEKEMKK